MFNLSKYVLIVFSVLALIITGCSEDDDDNGGTGPDNSNKEHMTADLEGDINLAFNASQTMLIDVSPAVTSINGLSDDGSLTISFQKNFTGKADFSDILTIGTFGTGATSQGYLAVSGELNITANDDEKIAGTFNFDAVSATNTTLSVKNGSFYVKK